MVDDDYKFLQIRDAITSINQKVNLIGVIFEIGFPKQSKGTDCFCTLKIIDESRPKPGISVNFFAESMEMLPHVASAGDIIQLSHVVIVHICEVAKDEWMAFLWDGTDAPPISLPTKLDDELNNPVPLQLEPVPLPRDVLCTFPTVGTVLRVIFDQGMQKHLLRFLHTGKWVKFVNVLCEVHSGLWRGVLTPFTKLQYTRNEDHLVSAWQRLYNERLSLKWGRIPYSSFPWPSNITDYDNVPFVTLMDILTCSKVTTKFKCVARVVAARPWQAEDFLSPLGTYRIRLTLEDPTARIHALLYGEDG
ncbi:protection of telomeres protein 1a, partial [Quercus suber]